MADSAAINSFFGSLKRRQFPLDTYYSIARAVEPLEHTALAAEPAGLVAPVRMGYLAQQQQQHALLSQSRAAAPLQMAIHSPPPAPMSAVAADQMNGGASPLTQCHVPPQPLQSQKELETMRESLERMRSVIYDSPQGLTGGHNLHMQYVLLLFFLSVYCIKLPFIILDPANT
jgi:hypothetical protein